MLITAISVFYQILKIGQKNQRIASTKLNQCSSRRYGGSFISQVSIQL